MGTYKSNSVCVGILPDVFRQVSSGHEDRNELGWRNGGTQERQDVRVLQVFPHYRLLAEHLRSSFEMVNI